MAQVPIDETVLNGWVKRLLQISQHDRMRIDLAGRIQDIVVEISDSIPATSNVEVSLWWRIRLRER